MLHSKGVFLLLRFSNRSSLISITWNEEESPHQGRIFSNLGNFHALYTNYLVAPLRVYGERGGRFRRGHIMTNEIQVRLNQTTSPFTNLSATPGEIKPIRRSFISQKLPVTPPSAQNSLIQMSGIEKLVSQIGELLSTLSSASQYGADQAQADRGLKIGAVAGARAAGQRVVGSAQALAVNEQRLAQQSAAAQSQSRSLDLEQLLSQLGEYGQKLILNDLKTSAVTETANALGMDPSKVSPSHMVEAAYNYIFGSPEASSLSSSPGAAVAPSMTVSGESVGAASTAGTIASGVGQIASFAGAAYSAFNLFKNFGKSSPIVGAVQGATVGAYIGSMIVPGAGTVIGGALGAVAGGLLGLFHTGKHKDQIARDKVRDMLQQGGIIDENWSLTLADGSKYDIGKDGGAKLKNADGTSRHTYDVDFSDPRVGEVIGLINPLTVLMTSGDPKLTADFTGYFTNAALSNAKTFEEARTNVLSIFASIKVSPQQLAEGLVKMAQEERISREDLKAYLNGLATLFDGLIQ